jgi:hypothetical protein
MSLPVEEGGDGTNPVSTGEQCRTNTPAAHVAKSISETAAHISHFSTLRNAGRRMRYARSTLAATIKAEMKITVCGKLTRKFVIGLIFPQCDAV